jgi:hypothetical protein
LQNFCLMGWAAGGPSNSGRREYFFYKILKIILCTSLYSISAHEFSEKRNILCVLCVMCR